MEELNYEYVRTKDSYKAAIGELNKANIIAIDLEFDRDHFAYGFTLCLIQVYIPHKAYLFDPFSLDDLSDLFKIITDEKVVKVMHAPGEDIQLLQQYGCYPKTIFDTERTARMLDHSAFSLSSLLMNILGIEISKSMQKSDWTRTPLSEKQLHYAALDVWYLLELYERLNELIKSEELRNWIAEENLFWNIYNIDNKTEGVFYNKDDGRKMPPYYLHVYNALLGVRDKYAKKLNKPGFKVVDKNILKDIAFKPEMIKQWTQLKGIHPLMKNQSVAVELENAFAQASLEAEKINLLKFKPGSRMSYEERMEQKEITLAMKEKSSVEWEKLRDYVIGNYGENVLSYIFSEKTLLAITTGEMTIESIPYSYRINLLRRFKA
jgi:ribonuclease D